MEKGKKGGKTDFVQPKPDTIFFRAARAVYTLSMYHIILEKCYLGYDWDGFQSRRQERGQRTQAFLAEFIDPG